MTARADTAALIKEASAPYWAADPYAYFLARGKLRGDPAFAGILRQGLLSGCKRILDLGCGQGLLASWLLAARSHAQEGAWPAEWPVAPQPTSIRGIDLRECAVRRARQALGQSAEFEVGDIREAEYRTADAIVILDVLHCIDYGAQERVLERAHAALASGGVLLLRVADADGGMRFAIGKYFDQTVLTARARRPSKVYCRSAREWLNVLAAGGFHTEVVPMSAGTPFANVMLIAHP
ncbi:MAG: class I SAM-dependent methyltransferase [Steroidobacteraceae bacterium]